MLTYITFGLVVLKYVLDFVAPRTKTKLDDQARDALDHVPLPSLPQAAKEAADKAGIKMEAKPVTGFGVARDHRG